MTRISAAMFPMLLCCGLLLLPATLVLGQQQKQTFVQHSRIQVLARSFGDSVIIRWSPDQAWAWTRLNHAGYRIERIDITNAGNPRFQALQAEPLKPFSLERLKTVFGPQSKYAAIAAQALYGRNFSLNVRSGPAGLADQADVLKNRFAFALLSADLDPQVAGAIALRWVDKAVIKGHVYIYRVYPAEAVQAARIDTGTVLVRNERNPPPPRPLFAEVIAGDRFAELHWNRFQAGAFTGYLIEKSEDGVHYTPLSDLPFFAAPPDTAVHTKDSLLTRIQQILRHSQVYLDSLKKNYQPYYYRFRGVNAFAERSDYSDTVLVVGRDLTPPAPVQLQNPVFVKDRSIRLNWMKPVREPDLKALYITRATQINGPYTNLPGGVLDKNATQFTDTAALEHGENFYVVVAVDTAGNRSASAPAMGLVPDSTPPLVPQGLKGRIDRNGLVHLSWHPNPDTDIRGYKVYFANRPDQFYSQITLAPWADTTFTDTIVLKTLTKHIWYKIVAVDRANNHSAYSAALELKKPDLVPPVPPLAKQVRVDSAVRIEFLQSPSTDVVYYIVYRQEEKGTWAPVQQVRHDPQLTSFSFSDPAVRPLTSYGYCAVAVDEDSLHSGQSTRVQASVRTLPDLPAIGTLQGSYDAGKKAVLLRWQYTGSGKYFFVLYRGTGNGQLLRYRSVNGDTDHFMEPLPGSDAQDFNYAIQVIYPETGRKSKVSGQVSITVGNSQQNQGTN